MIWLTDTRFDRSGGEVNDQQRLLNGDPDNLLSGKAYQARVQRGVNDYDKNKLFDERKAR